MPFRINCELCGTLIEAERRSRQYCAPCRPKAVVLNSVLKNLNAAVQADPVLVSSLMDMNIPNETNAISEPFPILDGIERFSPMVALAIALNDYGSISWDGTRFEIVRWQDRADVIGGELAANAADFRGLHTGEFVEPELGPRRRRRSPNERTSDEVIRALDEAVARTRTGGFRTHGISPADRSRIIGPGRGPMIYAPDPSSPSGFSHVGYASLDPMQPDEIFGNP